MRGLMCNGNSKRRRAGNEMSNGSDSGGRRKYTVVLNRRNTAAPRPVHAPALARSCATFLAAGHAALRLDLTKTVASLWLRTKEARETCDAFLTAWCASYKQAAQVAGGAFDERSQAHQLGALCALAPLSLVANARLFDRRARWTFSYFEPRQKGDLWRNCKRRNEKDERERASDAKSRRETRD